MSRDELDGFILDLDDISTCIEHRQMARPYVKLEGQHGNRLHTYEFGNSTRLFNGLRGVSFPLAKDKE